MKNNDCRDDSLLIRRLYEGPAIGAAAHNLFMTFVDIKLGAKEPTPYKSCEIGKPVWIGLWEFTVPTIAGIKEIVKRQIQGKKFSKYFEVPITHTHEWSIGKLGTLRYSVDHSNNKVPMAQVKLVAPRLKSIEIQEEWNAYKAIVPKNIVGGSWEEHLEEGKLYEKYWYVFENRMDLAAMCGALDSLDLK